MYELPIFPLHTVLFPGMPLRLHIFEPRYQAMFKRVLETTRTFGVCCIKTGEEALGPLALPYPVGCTARVIDVEKLDDGHMNITAVGEERFQILNPNHSLPYLSAMVESTPLKSHLSLDVVRGTQLLRRQVTSYLSILTSLAEIT